MASEFRLRYVSTGSNLYALLLRGSDGFVWNGSTFVTPAAAGWTTYALTLTEQSTTRLYYGNMPSSQSAGLYDYLVFLRAGGSPAVSDTLVGQGRIDWSGSADVGTSGTRITKNVALANFEFVMISSSDNVSPITGRTVTATRSLDGAAFAACANSVTELSNGVYKINLAAGDLNGDTVTLRFAASGALDTLLTIVTQP